MCWLCWCTPRLGFDSPSQPQYLSITSLPYLMDTIIQIKNLVQEYMNITKANINGECYIHTRHCSCIMVTARLQTNDSRLQFTV